jgi:hypothetical protein
MVLGPNHSELARAHTHTHTHTHSQTHSCARTHAHAHTHTLSHTQTHTHSLSPLCRLTALEGDSSNGVSLAQTSLLRARALQQMGDPRAALMAAREAHNLFAQKFGDSDVSICDSFF